MSEMVKVVVDAMGGDNAPVEPVKAAVEAVKEKQNIQVILTGQNFRNPRIIRKTESVWYTLPR